MRITDSCDLEKDARLFSRTRAGLGSGLELIIPGDLKDIWMTTPIFEDFVHTTPYRLLKENSHYVVEDTRGKDLRYPVVIPPNPSWYHKKTSNGTPMTQIGVLQGTYLGIYIGKACGFWSYPEQLQCKFCTTGVNVGQNEVETKKLQDIIEVAQAAKAESGVTFCHFNSGYQDTKDLETAAPYIKAIKENVGLLVGAQLIPTLDFWKYDWLVDLGVNHFSYCYEFQNPEYFAKYLPGKEKLVKQATFFKALEYTSRKLGKGRCSGEIIAGIEPIEDTLKAIDYITGVGAFPTICIFRPLKGAKLEDYPSPGYEDMLVVFKYLIESCMKRGLPIGLAPNIEVSLVVQPDDAKYLVNRDFKFNLYNTKLKIMKNLAGLILNKELKPRKISADETSPAAYAPKA